MSFEIKYVVDPITHKCVTGSGKTFAEAVESFEDARKLLLEEVEEQRTGLYRAAARA